MEIDGWTNEWRMECLVYGEATRKRKKKKEMGKMDPPLTCSLTAWLKDWLTHRLSDWLTDKPIDCLTHRLTIWLTNCCLTDWWMNERMEDRMSGVWRSYSNTKKKKGNRKMDLSDLFTNCMTERLTDSSTVWQTDWLTHWLSDSLTVWPTDWLTNSLTGWLTDWLSHWLTGSSTVWLTDFLTDRLTDCQKHLVTCFIMD